MQGCCRPFWLHFCFPWRIRNPLDVVTFSHHIHTFGGSSHHFRGLWGSSHCLYLVLCFSGNVPTSCTRRQACWALDVVPVIEPSETSVNSEQAAAALSLSVPPTNPIKALIPALPVTRVCATSDISLLEH